MLIWTSGWTALAFNDAKRDLTVVEIGLSQQQDGCLLAGSVPHWLEKTTLKILGNCWMLLSAVEFCWCVMCDTSDAPFHFLHRSRSATFSFVWLVTWINYRLPLNIRCPQLLSTTSCRKELLDWNRREFLPSKVFLLLLRSSVHLPRSASSNFLAGEDVLLFPRAQTWTDITHGLVQLSTCSHVLLNAGQVLPA